MTIRNFSLFNKPVKLPRAVSMMLRVGVTIGAIYLAFSQVELHEMLPMLARQPIAYVLFAIVMVQSTQFVGGWRMRYYLQRHGISLPKHAAVQLQYVGELFSAVLPGGAAGDVYKAWWLKRYLQGGLLNMAKVMIGARLNGLWALGVFACVLLLFSPVPQLVPHGYELTVLLLIAGTVGYMLFARFVLREPLKQQVISALCYSLPIQSMIVLGAIGICYGLGIGEYASSYVMLYLLSCVLALLPISIGGIGVRELALLHGSRLLLLPEEGGVALAFTLTIMGLSVPIVGAVIKALWKPQDHAVPAA